MIILPSSVKQVFVNNVAGGDRSGTKDVVCSQCSDADRLANEEHRRQSSLQDKRHSASHIQASPEVKICIVSFNIEKYQKVIQIKITSTGSAFNWFNRLLSRNKMQ